MKTHILYSTASWTLLVWLPASAEVSFTRVDAGAIGDDPGHYASVAWGDYDGDGWVDLFAAFNAYYTASEPSRLYHNNGDGTFTKVLTGGLADDMSPLLNYGGASAWADFENDGDLDLYVSQYEWLGAPGMDRFYLNNGDGTFTRAGQDWITAVDSIDMTWGDFDNDGRVDLFVVSNSTGVSKLYHHLADGSMQANDFPVTTPGQYTFNVEGSDFDHDGDLDLFINRQTGNGLIHLNDGEGVFTPDPGLPILKGNGVGLADYDNDGDLDLAKTVFSGTIEFHQNEGGGAWLYNMVTFTGDAISCIGVSWGDYDNDGYIDLFIPNFTHPGLWEGPNLLFHNEGDGTFTRVTEGPLVTDLGASWGAGWADYDNDGDLDIALPDGHNQGGRGWPLPATSVALYRNDGGNENNWINLNLVGTVSNRSAIGAKVFAHATIDGSAVQQMREVSGGGGFSQSDLRVHFGLGDAEVIDTLRIEWPSGAVDLLTDVVANQFLTVTEGAAPLMWGCYAADLSAHDPNDFGWVDTGQRCGWLYLYGEPHPETGAAWAYSMSLDNFLFFPHAPTLEETGKWVFLTTPTD